MVWQAVLILNLNVWPPSITPHPHPLTPPPHNHPVSPFHPHTPGDLNLSSQQSFLIVAWPPPHPRAWSPGYGTPSSSTMRPFLSPSWPLPFSGIFFICFWRAKVIEWSRVCFLCNIFAWLISFSVARIFFCSFVWIILIFHLHKKNTLVKPEGTKCPVFLVDPQWAWVVRLT